jgi:membrane protein
MTRHAGFMGWLRGVKFVLKLWKEVGEDDLSDAASALAYKFFLALFPFFIFIVALSGFAGSLFGVDDPRAEIMSTLATALPADAYSVIDAQVSNVVESKNAALLSVGIIGAIWAASSGMGSFMKALNRVYEVKETRPFYKKYAIAVGLTLLAGGLMVGSLVVLLAGQFFALDVARQLGLEDSASTLIVVVRWPLAIVALMMAVAFLYGVAPNIDLPIKWISPGAIFFTLTWLVATFAFGLYVANFGSYGDTYGALGGVVILLVWLYLTSFILLVGAEFNSVLAQQSAPAEVEARAGDAATAVTATGGKTPEESEEPPKRREGLLAGLALRVAGAAFAFWWTRRAARSH